jgi:hypothetical protein
MEELIVEENWESSAEPEVCVLSCSYYAIHYKNESNLSEMVVCYSSVSYMVG